MLKKALSYVASTLGLVLLAAVLLHVFIVWVHPEQEAPEGHIPGPCWACHMVSSSAEMIELEE